MNPVAKSLPKGLELWRKARASVKFLTSEKISVPCIWLGSNSRKVVLIQSGLHLEETSGPLLLLEPLELLPILQAALKKGIGFVIYPLINNYGLRHDSSEHEKLLRYNEKGINYNDGWGVATTKKCLEVKIVESDIKKILKTKDILLALSLHEDSTSKKKGYLWTNSVNKTLRALIENKLLTKIDKKLLVNSTQKTIEGGKVEKGFVIVGAKDKGTFEHWMGEDLKIPTVLSEAPFRLKLETRINFHLEVIASTISSFLVNH